MRDGRPERTSTHRRTRICAEPLSLSRIGGPDYSNQSQTLPTLSAALLQATAWIRHEEQNIKDGCVLWQILSCVKIRHTMQTKKHSHTYAGTANESCHKGKWAPSRSVNDGERWSVCACLCLSSFPFQLVKPNTWWRPLCQTAVWLKEQVNLR